MPSKYSDSSKSTKQDAIQKSIQSFDKTKIHHKTIDKEAILRCYTKTKTFFTTSTHHNVRQASLPV